MTTEEALTTALLALRRDGTNARRAGRTERAADDAEALAVLQHLEPLRIPAAHVYYAEVETAHFTFFACGRTEKQAREAVMNTWHAHVDRTGAEPDYVQADDVNVQRCALGQGYLDEAGYPLGEPAQP